MTDALERIRSHRERLRGKALMLASFIAQNYRRVAFMSARELAEAAGVSLPTVIRFVASIGFDGYQAFSRTLQERLNLELTGVERLEQVLQKKQPQPLYMQVISRELQALKQLMASFPQEHLTAVAGRLATATAVVVVGPRYVAPLTSYLVYTLRKLRGGVTGVTVIDSTAYDDLALQPSDTVVVGIGFARYATELLDFLEFARKQRFEIAVVTDHAVSPLGKAADHVLMVPVPPMKFMSFLAAPAALVNVLVLEVALRLGSKGTDRLQNLEEVAKAKNTYFADTGKDFRRTPPVVRATPRRRAR